jgi:hypothetical protein
MNDAWQHAHEIAGLLPPEAVWCFCITDVEDDAVFNIYAPREAWHKLRLLLSLPVPEFRFDATGEFPAWEEYNLAGLTLSFITPEEHDDDESA